MIDTGTNTIYISWNVNAGENNNLTNNSWTTIEQIFVEEPEIWKQSLRALEWIQLAEWQNMTTKWLQNVWFSFPWRS